jgi:hypothetical protein
MFIYFCVVTKRAHVEGMNAATQCDDYILVNTY